MSSQKMRWEIALEKWDSADALVVAELRSVATRRDVNSYSDLVGRVGYFSGPDSHALADMLGEINEAERLYKSAPLLLSASVTHKHDKYPGVGFFDAAKALGLQVPSGDEEMRVFRAVEMERVHEAYGSKGDRRP